MGGHCCFDLDVGGIESIFRGVWRYGRERLYFRLE